MQRIFVTFPLSIDVILTDKEIYHQLTRVMRIQIWESIVLFDGDGSETEYEVTAIDKKSMSLRGKNRVFSQTEPKKKIILYQAIPNKYEKIEYILQKWVEVGISEFVFFRSDRSQKLILSPSKIERFMAIAREAVEQCGGVKIPSITFHEKNILSTMSSSLSLRRKEESILDEVAKKEQMLPTSAWQKNITLDTIGLTRTFREFTTMNEYHLWIGPEGGWSDDEREKMSANSFIFARFGERVLRTETAGVVTAFALLHA